MKVDDIAFEARPSTEGHPRYTEFRTDIGRFEFSAYRNVFERVWAEGSIISGERVSLRELDLLPPEDDAPIAFLMGRNEHVAARIGYAAEFFSEYLRQGRAPFLRTGYGQTGYARSLGNIYHGDPPGGLRGMIRRTRARHAIRRQCAHFLDMFERMRAAGGLVGADAWGTRLTPWDVPWAIEYGTYIKLRDGAHRRAIAHYLGWRTIPTLVYTFDRPSPADLVVSSDYLARHILAFTEIVDRTLECSARAER